MSIITFQMKNVWVLVQMKTSFDQSCMSLILLTLLKKPELTVLFNCSQDKFNN